MWCCCRQVMEQSLTRLRGGGLVESCWEAGRLAALARLDLLEDGRDPEFEELVQLAAAVCGAPVAMVGFLAADRHVVKAVVGRPGSSVPRAGALCEVPIRTGSALVVGDLPADEVLAQHPAVTGPDGVRAYAGAPVCDEDGTAIGTLCVLDTRPRPFSLVQVQTLTTLAHQVTTLLRVRRRDVQLQVAAQVLHAAMDRAPVGIAVIDVHEGRAGRLGQVNPAYCALVGRTAQELAQLTVLELTHPDDLGDDGPSLARVVAGSPEVRLKRYLRPDGSVVWAEVTGSPLVTVDGRVETVVIHAIDVTDRLARESDLLDQARTDPLTGLANRTFLLEWLAAHPSGVIAYLDLDGFKPVNDQHGHDVGDAVLKRVAERLRGALRAGDLLARVGGDEFVAVLDTDLADAAATVERLHDVMADAFNIGQAVAHLSVSAGLATIRHGAWQDALTAADTAMYQRKRQRRQPATKAE